MCSSAASGLRVVIGLLVLSAPLGVARAAVQPAEGAPSGVPAGLEPPKLLTEFELAYPEALAQTEAPPSGRVIIRFVVGVDGVPKELRVEQAVAPQLDQLALEAVAQARYEPGRYQGQPVEIETTLPFDFTPPAPQPDPEPAAGPTGQDPEPGPDGEVDDPDAADGLDAQPEGPTPGEDPLPPVTLGNTGPVSVEGTLLEGGQRTPIANAPVIAVPGDGLKPGRVTPRASKKWREGRGPDKWTAQTTTGPDGTFTFRGLPDGTVLLVFLSDGFDRLEYVVEVQGGSIVEGKYYQTRQQTNPYRTVVRTEAPRAAEVTRRVVSTEEVARLPGSQGDPLKGIQNFPGLARTPFGVGALVIRGAAPGDSAVYLGGHELPQLYHFGGLQSVFNGDMIQDIAYVPGNFDSAFGDATGGIVDVTPKSPRKDGYHGYVDADVFDASALVQGPVKDGAFAASLRRSYADLILRNIDALTLAPRYWDYQGTFTYPVGKGEIGFRVLGSDDQFIPLSELTEDVVFTRGFHRGDLFYTWRRNKWSVFVSPSFTYATQNENSSREDDYTFSIRGEATWTANRQFDMNFGTETRLGWANLDLASPPVTDGPPFGVQLPVSSTSRVNFAYPGLYATANLRAGRSADLVVSPSVRLTGYATPVGQVAVDPRLNARWKVGQRVALKAGVGIYSQAPAFRELDEVFGNPNLDPERSLQTSLGVGLQLPYDLSLELTGFYKDLWDLAQPSDEIVERNGTLVPERLASTGIGRSFGGEVLFRRDFSKDLYGWLAYTLSRTQIRPTPNEPFRVAEFDQTHILNLLVGYKLPRNWSLGARFRLTSGNPTTPLANGIYDSTSGSYRPFGAPELSGRLPLFHQLDLRVDKTWTFNLVRLLLYLDVQNVYNQQNAEFLAFSYDFRESARINSVPIVPSLGLRLDF